MNTSTNRLRGALVAAITATALIATSPAGANEWILPRPNTGRMFVLETNCQCLLSGAAYLALALAEQSRGRTTDASEAFAAASLHLDSTLGPDHPMTRQARESSSKVQQQL